MSLDEATVEPDRLGVLDVGTEFVVVLSRMGVETAEYDAEIVQKAGAGQRALVKWVEVEGRGDAPFELKGLERELRGFADDFDAIELRLDEKIDGLPVAMAALTDVLRKHAFTVAPGEAKAVAALQSQLYWEFGKVFGDSTLRKVKRGSRQYRRIYAALERTMRGTSNGPMAGW